MSQPAPINIDSVSKQFGKKIVLDNISLQVPAGSIFGLIGLNGVGKTTLIKTILGLLNPDSGAASIYGNAPKDISARKHYSYLPEKFFPSHYLKGKEFLRLTLSYYDKQLDMAQAEAMAESMELAPKALEQKITSYSKGMTQKLGLITAIMIDAPLLILDEPMSGLDPLARIRLKDALNAYAKKGNTIFFSSHILSDIDEICSQIAIINDTKIIFDGSPKDFKGTFKGNSLERSFLTAIES